MASMRQNQTGRLAEGEHAKPSSENNYNYFLENGRYYGQYRPGKYLVPVDERETDCMDIFHKFFMVARASHFGGLHMLPLPPNPKILDLGCGTGIWAIDMADRYYEGNPETEIYGWDLSLYQPPVIPHNIRFLQRDIEDNWSQNQYFAANSLDFIHMRMLAGGVSSWRSLYQQIYTNLKPGGIMEHTEIDFRPLFENADSNGHWEISAWATQLSEAMARAGKPITINTDTKKELEAVGFTEVQEIVETVPLNPWSDDPIKKEMGRWFNLAFTHSLEGMTLAPFYRLNGQPADKTREQIDRVKQEVFRRDFRASCVMYTWTARKP